MEAEWLDVPTASQDAILSRWGYMLLADPETALREARRVLRPGGADRARRLGADRRQPVDRGAPGASSSRAGSRRTPCPARRGCSRSPRRGRVEELLSAAGFADVGVEPVRFTWQAPSLDAWWEHQRAVSISLGAALDALTPAEHYALRDAVDAGYAPYVAADGSVALPACSLVAWAEA